MKKKTAIIIMVCLLAGIAVIVFRQLHGGNRTITALQGMCIDELEIVEARNMSGIFVEDGSNEKIDSVFALKVRNTGEKTLQYALVHLTCGDKEYQFAITTLPANETVVVQEQARQSCATKGDWRGFAEYLIWFEKEPNQYEDIFSLTTAENNISLQNISDTDITGPISVYYKNLADKDLMGGITYRVTLQDGLSAGESDTCYAAHYIPENSKIMFIDYVS